jgi:hypothetical protein
VLLSPETAQVRARPHGSHIDQLTSTPVVRLKVEGVQNVELITGALPVETSPGVELLPPDDCPCRA